MSRNSSEPIPTPDESDQVYDESIICTYSHMYAGSTNSCSLVDNERFPLTITSRTTRPRHTARLKLNQDNLASSSGAPFHLWRQNLAALAPTSKRWRFPGKRWRFEESASPLIKCSASDYPNSVRYAMPESTVPRCRLPTYSLPLPLAK